MKRFKFYKLIPSDFIQDDGTRGEWVETTEEKGTHVIDLSAKGQAVAGSKDLNKLSAKMRKYINDYKKEVNGKSKH